MRQVIIQIIPAQFIFELIYFCIFINQQKFHTSHLGKVLKMIRCDCKTEAGMMSTALIRVEPNSTPREVFPLSIAFWISLRFTFVSFDLKPLFQTENANGPLTESQFVLEFGCIYT